MLLIYSETITARLKYAVQLILDDLSGIPTVFTDKVDDYLSGEGPRINYSARDLGHGMQIIPSSLLFENTVIESKPEAGTFRGLPVLFPSGGGFGFDVFAASFYMVTRYEEYYCSKKDRYGRFQSKHSIAKACGFDHEPVVNRWAALLAGALRETWPGLAMDPPHYRFVSTIDVDHAYAYRNRTLVRTLGGMARSLGNMEIGQISERMMVLAGLRDDPYDTFGYIRDFHVKHEILPLYFILFADYGGDDNNVSLGKKEFRSLLARLADETTVGIHPSLSSNRNPERLTAEIEGLASVAGREIHCSRQHFLKFSFPNTFRRLVTNGITDDYSMGYATTCGFRAGIASPFRFFDLKRNEVTPLRFHPVSMMDVTCHDYLHLTPDESIARVKQQADLVRSVNGEFVSIWHNESLSDHGKWKGWRRVFEETTAYAAHHSQ